MKNFKEGIHTLLKRAFLIPVYLYKGLLSPFFGSSCLYHPSCSSYMVEAVMKHGVLKGFVMGFARILRCSRFFMGGDDTVPEVWSWKQIKDGFIIYRRH
ncbi:membrane protein insertion efficiency factor YidD [Sphaerochaeta sp. PS]|uniref:membrane protein insertion efficiency factor YidD n=1 Tax=Sphaerochaeta sp. PS TaxID=3076336 RepID=UPI0028A536FB|nr:membrane protein insertion efficiency factor YidD [Sphaerochaeta sp. PS]MDT4762411.1 membrane protein insertion efficiency factor YidD [Sphaerochaeta sp. PS]